MIKHVVMWRLKDKSLAEEMKEKLLSLKNEIDVIVDIEVGINISKADSAYDIILMDSFKTEEDMEIYRNHPYHLKIVEYINGIVSDRASVDYVI